LSKLAFVGKLSILESFFYFGMIGLLGNIANAWVFQ
jgi:hypothetical protein